MSDMTIRELRNHGGEVVDRAARGEQITITRAGRPVAELRPVAPEGLTATALLARWRSLPHVDPAPTARRPRRAAGRRTVSHARGILDTSTVILLPQLEDSAALPQEPLITTVTLAELPVGPLVARDERERAARQAQLQQAEADFAPLPFDAAAARACARVAASLRRSGRKPAARAYDAMIAATAIANDLPVYTANAADFRDIDELEVVGVQPPPRQRGRQPSAPTAATSHERNVGEQLR